MSGEVHVYEAIDIVPPVEVHEILERLESGDYTKITWDDPRMGDGYFVLVGAHGTIGIAVTPDVADNGTVADRGTVIQANPLSENHVDEKLESELRKIITDFGISPNGMRRAFDRALHIEKPDGDQMISVRDGAPFRSNVE
jgi:hypothetical protein